MKRVSLILFLTCSLGIVEAQFRPPGTIQIDSIFIDATEITNVEYQEYLHYIKRDSAKGFYNKALPDTTVWSKIYDNPLAAAFSYDYLRKPQFRRFPVVGVTAKQAENYCLWRSQVVNKKLDSLPYRINYRLPSPEEWFNIAIVSSSYQVINQQVDLSKMKFTRTDLIDIKNKSETDLSLPKLRAEIIKFYERNSILLFENLSTPEDFEFKEYLGIGGGPKRSLSGISINNIRGNVSELTSEVGVAMGGNWTLTYAETPAEAQFTYQEPSALLGFRCICDLLHD